MVSRGSSMGAALTRGLLRLVLSAIVVTAFAVTPCAFALSTPPAPPAVASAPADARVAAKVATETSGPQVNTADILKRLNQDLGLNLNATTAAWQHELDRVEGDLRRPGLHYSQLDTLRAELQQVRAKVDNLSNRLRPRFNATNAKLNLLGPAPAVGQSAPE